MTDHNRKLLFTDPTDQTWTLEEFAGKAMIFHACNKTSPVDHYSREDKPADACAWCLQEPPEGFIALYKLYTWDK